MTTTQLRMDKAAVVMGFAHGVPREQSMGAKAHLATERGHSLMQDKMVVPQHNRSQKPAISCNVMFLMS